MSWLIIKIWAAWDWIEETCWECGNWLRIRLRPDPRSTDEILASVKVKLEEMPAAKEIHVAHQIIENVQAERELAGARRSKEGE